MMLNIYPFLAVTERVETKVLVVEGWVHEYAIRAAVEEFNHRSYERVFTTGGPVAGSGGYTNDFNTAAGVGAELLRKHGISDLALTIVPSHVMSQDRTYGAAVALRNWLLEHGVAVQGMNVVTEDAHARRTRLLFQAALGKSVEVGIIAVPNPDYDSGHWWRYSEGVRDVVGESIAYIYARCFFHPAEERAGISRD